MSETKSILVTDQFFDQADRLRAHYLQQFSNPLRADEGRFVWDYWHVPSQYTLLRTSAESYFPEDIFAPWLDAICGWGFENLGCGEISPPWLSYYIDGCEQSLHADNPHGPWAFVFSLTDWDNRRFIGGETQLLSPMVLDYWRDFESAMGFETDTLLNQVEPLFNRLTVFDPRIPHGVAPVRGEKDPRRARIVIHGWFLEPQPSLEGGLEEVDLELVLAEALDPVLDRIENEVALNGYVGFRLVIAPSGHVKSLKVLQNTLKSISSDPLAVEGIGEEFSAVLKRIQFPEASTESVLTFPLIFK
jgi:hypothetical protein